MSGIAYLSSMRFNRYWQVMTFSASFETMSELARSVAQRGNIIRRARKQRHLSQRELEAKAGLR